MNNNKENNLIDETAAAADNNDGGNDHVKASPRRPHHQQLQQQRRVVLLPALNPSRKQRNVATTTETATAADDATQSSSSMLTSSTTSNASLRTNNSSSTSGGSGGVFSRAHHNHHHAASSAVNSSGGLGGGGEEEHTMNSVTSYNSAYTSLTTTTAGGTGQQRVLRYGETIDSLFCLPPPTSSSENNNNNNSSNNGNNDVVIDATKHKQLCQNVCLGELSNDAKSWCDALIMTLQVNSTAMAATATSSSTELGKRLIQLLRRATSRFKLTKLPKLQTTAAADKNDANEKDNNDENAPEKQQQQQQQEEEILKIWLLYALVLVKYNTTGGGGNNENDNEASLRNDAVQTYRHIQRLRFGSSSGGNNSSGGSTITCLSEEFYSALLINKGERNNNTASSITVEEVVQSLKDTMNNNYGDGISLIDIFHTQMDQLDQCRRNSRATAATTSTTIAATATTTNNSTTKTKERGGRAIASLPALKGVKQRQTKERENNSATTTAAAAAATTTTTAITDNSEEDTFDLKLKSARSKLEEGLKNSSSNNNSKRLASYSALRGGTKSSSIVHNARKKPRRAIGTGKLGAILSSSQTIDDDQEEDDDNDNFQQQQQQRDDISPKDNSLFQDNISPIEAEPSTSIKDMDLDYLLNWDPTKRGGGAGGVAVSRKKKVTIAEGGEEFGKDDEDDAKQPVVKKITRNDLGYMLNWEPFAERQQQQQQKNNSGEDESAGTGGNGSVISSSKDAPKRRTATTSTTRGMSTIDEEMDVSSMEEEEEEEEENKPTKAQDKSKKDESIAKKELESSRSFGTDLSRTDDQSEKMISTSQLDCSFLPLIENKNIIRVDGEPYAKLGVIGKGGSCKVYRALSTECDVVALKKVKLDGLNKQAIDGYANEIALLKRLKGNPAIIQLYSAEVDYERKSILLVMELGEVDLNYVLRQQELLSSKQRSSGPGKSSLNMNFIRLTWQQMLTAVHSIHEERIIHSDLKPANFLFVRGALKLIDFGIAKAIEREDTTNVYRETLSGTLSYMSPEAIMDTSTNAKGVRVNKCGRPSDIWSLGCILYQMVYGKTPFADCHGIPQKVLAITNVNHEIPYPGGVDESAIDAMKQCLQRNPKLRPPIVGKNGLLNEHYFLHGKTKSNQH